MSERFDPSQSFDLMETEAKPCWTPKADICLVLPLRCFPYWHIHLKCSYLLLRKTVNFIRHHCWYATSSCGITKLLEWHGMT